MFSSLNLFNPFLPSFRKDPYPTYQRLRQEQPVYAHPLGFWVLSRYGNINTVLRDKRFASPDPKRWQNPILRVTHPKALGAVENTLRRVMSLRDDRTHTLLRALTVKAFSQDAVAASRAKIERMAEGILDQLPHDGAFDLVDAYASELPIRVIADVMGFSENELPWLKQGAYVAATMLDPIVWPGDLKRQYERLEEFQAYAPQLLSERRAHPRPDLLGALAEASRGDGAVDEESLVANAGFLVGAGSVTTINLIANGVLALLSHPEEMRRLRDAPELEASAVEEMLRYDSPMQMTGRRALEDVEIGGKTIRKDEHVVLLLASGNRDAERFREPDVFDIGRPDNEHLAFSAGPHVCSGLHLARAEGQIAVSALLRRYPRLRLGPGSPEWRKSVSQRWPLRVPIVAEGTT